MKNTKTIYNLIVVGGSNGGMDAFMKILSGLSPDFHIPIAFVLHQQRGIQTLLPDILSRHTNLIVNEPLDKEQICDGHVYIAPSDYHLLIEPDGTFSYSYSEPINFSRPSIDILFETAAESFGNQVVGILLTGANNDGAKGLFKIQNKGGFCIVQSPKTARSQEMPQSAIGMGCDKHIIDLDQIAIYLNTLNMDNILNHPEQNG